MGSEQNRFPQQQERAPRRKRWGGCWGGLSCFGTHKGGKRIVPATRIPEANSLANATNGPQNAGLTNQTTTLVPSLLAPPSSPASFSNSALPSTAQSPSCFLSMSANSPEGPSSTMFATGPYAHETQLVSPPVFSTFTTEPSTAPLTPPPELAHITTPSSPDVPYAQFLSSSMDLKGAGKTNYITSNDLQATYSLYPGSPASSLRSPVSRTPADSSSSFPRHENPSQWDPSISSHDANYQSSESGRFTGLETPGASKLSQDSNFFCPATFAQFYLDHSSFPHSGGRLSVSKESDAYSNGGNGHQNRQNKTCKPDAEELEAYRASFGFSADEIITTAQYVEISDVLDDPFTMTPFTDNKPHIEGRTSSPTNEGQKAGETNTKLQSQKQNSLELDDFRGVIYGEMPGSGNNFDGHISRKQTGNASGRSPPGNHILTDEEEIVFSRMGSSKISRKYQLGLSSSDAEIDYRRGRSLRGGKGDFAWHD